MVEEIEATYGLTTPLFSSGADPGTPELRPPSFKGVLRFWWRALAWSRFQGNLKQIHEAEQKLFGSASTGRGKVALRLEGPSEDTLRKAVLKQGELLRSARGSHAPPIGAGARYLGYGLMEAFASPKKGTQAGQLVRACLQAPLEFKVVLRCRSLDAMEQTLLRDALKVLGLLGGLGARTRRGYGSLVLRSLKEDARETWTAPKDIGSLDKELRKLHEDSPAERSLPLYTALSRRARYVLLGGRTEDSPLKLLDLLGREMVRFRSWGRGGRILEGEETEKLFKDDHDLMKMPPRERRSHPRRIVFGLPHNYGSPKYGSPKEKKVEPAGDLDRRASPLFVHVHSCGATPVLVLAFLPAVFLPPGGSGRAQIDVGGKEVRLADENQLWKPIDDFLDRLLGRGETPCKESFHSREEVRP